MPTKIKHWTTNSTESVIETSSDTEFLIEEIGQDIIKLLKSKNKAYGNTANNPPQIFSKLSAKEGILARIDDKLSRITKLGFDNNDSEDTLKDLIGYLILLKVQIRIEENTNS
tara:strand:+ start:170 stop:508 length:339 start_codon:yes stop_codon:yes gene_type:complete